MHTDAGSSIHYLWRMSVAANGSLQVATHNVNEILRLAELLAALQITDVCSHVIFYLTNRPLFVFQSCMASHQ